MSSVEFIARWESLLEREWELLSDLGAGNWDPEFASYLAEKDELLRQLPLQHVPRRLLFRIQRQQQRLMKALKEGGRALGGALYTKDGAARS